MVSHSQPERTVAEREQARVALGFLWARLGRPLNVIGAIGALLGLPHAVTRQFVGAMLATSDEAEGLLDDMPTLLRSLAINTVARAERNIGQVRGPILWNETMSARSATAGDPGLFVCATPARAYETDENFVLATALEAIARAGADVDRISAGTYDDDLLRRARLNGSKANRYLEHRALASLRSRKATRRNIHRCRSGHRRKIYAPALAMVARSEEPIEMDHLLPFCDQRTVAQHDLVAAVVRRLEGFGYSIPSFWVDGGVLHAGPVHYRHTHLRGDAGSFSGVLVGQVLLDVPDSLTQRDPVTATGQLEQRKGPATEVMAVLGPHDVHRGVERAVELGLD